MEEATATAWEALDIDDSDLPSLLRPCKLRRHSTATAIPGPAGALQAAMNRKSQLLEEPLSTQDYLRKALEDDFSQPPWLCALDFLRHEGLVDCSGLLLTMPLRLIAADAALQRVPQVVAIIKSCTSNGLGDMMVTLKDPTGTVGASIHRTVLTEGDFGKDISAGAVLILKQVAVFCPSRTAQYLNITPSNVVKVISKVCEPPLKQNDVASTVEYTVSATERRETSAPGLQGRKCDASVNPEDAVRKEEGVAVNANNEEQQEVSVSVSVEKPLSQFGHAETQRATDNSNDGVKKPPTWLPEWTDEQLQELFTLD